MAKVPMGPPPPRQPLKQSESQSESESELPKQSHAHAESVDTSTAVAAKAEAKSKSKSESTFNVDSLEKDKEAEAAGLQSSSYREAASQRDSSSSCGPKIYQMPSWSDLPGQPYFLEVLKDGSIIANLNVSEKGAYMFGRSDQCDFILEHPSISRHHAVLQFNGTGNAFIYDIGSTHGTFVNKIQVKPKIHKEVHVGDIFRFGQSTRLYILQGPAELMPSERPTIGGRQNMTEMQDLEEKAAMGASLLRARQDAAVADGISWGMSEDATDEDAKDNEEVTWQTFKGQLTEKQEKTRNKVIKRMEKLANLKKEIEAIRAKEIAQGGLTQGQQTQIARNEQRIEQILEELENLEETLNESIQESIGLRGGRLGYKKTKSDPDEDDFESDDDEFYDRTNKGRRSQKNAEKQQVVETVDSLLDKKEYFVKAIEDVKAALQEEKAKNSNKSSSENAGSDDPLDAFMTGVSSQIGKDQEMQLEHKLEKLQSDMERIVYLLKIADPTGEASQRRQSHVCLSEVETKSEKFESTCLQKSTISVDGNETRLEKKLSKRSCTVSVDGNETKLEQKLNTKSCNIEETRVPKANTEDEVLEQMSVLKKPVWLGAGHSDTESAQIQNVPGHLDSLDSDHFVSYKDRKAVQLPDNKNEVSLSSFLEEAKGLVLRKPKEINGKVDKEGESSYISDSSKETITTGSDNAEASAADAVALLLKHKRGLVASDEEHDSQNPEAATSSMHQAKKKGRQIGPTKPDFLNSETDNYDSWLPPRGQTGDGRTALNDKYGY